MTHCKKIGQILLEQKIISQNQLDQALFRQHSNHEQIGQILIDLGYINPTQLEEALSLQDSQGLTSDKAIADCKQN